MGATGVDPELRRFVAGEHRRLVGLLALHTGDRWVAEELAQDAVIRLCQHWPRVAGMSDPRAWLNRVGINLANSWFRRRAAERRALSRVPRGQESVREETADTVAVRAAVGRLPQRQRTALVLRYYADMSVAQTAEAMGCAEGTVKALTHRAVGELRASGLVEETQEVPHGR